MAGNSELIQSGAKSRWLWLTVPLVVFWCYGMLCLCVTWLLPRPTWVIVRWWIDLLITTKVDDINQLTNDSYSNYVSGFLGVWGTLGAASATVGTCIYWRRFNREVKRRVAAAEQRFNRRQGFDVEPVQEGTIGDLKWMTPYYRNAGKIIVFAGSFDWLNNYKPLRKIIVELAKKDKITFISYRDEGVVRNALSKIEISDGDSGSTNLYDILKERFRFNSGLKIICSLVWDKLEAETRFLYRSPSKTHAFNACVLLDTEHSKLLVKIIGDLIKARRWGVQIDEATPNDQDARRDLHDDGFFQVE